MNNKPKSLTITLWNLTVLNVTILILISVYIHILGITCGVIVFGKWGGELNSILREILVFTLGVSIVLPFRSSYWVKLKPSRRIALTILASASIILFPTIIYLDKPIIDLDKPYFSLYFNEFIWNMLLMLFLASPCIIGGTGWPGIIKNRIAHRKVIKNKTTTSAQQETQPTKPRRNRLCIAINIILSLIVTTSALLICYAIIRVISEVSYMTMGQ